MANYSINAFENEFDRGIYARELRNYFENKGLDSWWVSASAQTSDIFIQPKNYKEHLWESFPTISRISVRIDSNDGNPSFGISGYNEFQIRNTMDKFEAKGYNYHRHIDKRGKKGRWWLIKKFNNLESIAGELKEIEPFLYETSKKT
jgi:hypothetical protein